MLRRRAWALGPIHPARSLAAWDGCPRWPRSPRRRTAARRAPRRSASARCCRCARTAPAPVWNRARHGARARGRRQARMQRHAGARQQLAAARQIEHVVGVATVGGAATRRDKTTVAQLAQVVGDQALAPARQRASSPTRRSLRANSLKSRHRNGCPASRRNRAGELSTCPAASLIGLGTRISTSGSMRNETWSGRSPPKLTQLIDAGRLPYRINDYAILPGSRRAICADIAILHDAEVAIAVEFKFEPSHRREDIQKQKLPVVLWGPGRRGQRSTHGEAPRPGGRGAPWLALYGEGVRQVRGRAVARRTRRCSPGSTTNFAAVVVEAEVAAVEGEA